MIYFAGPGKSLAGTSKCNLNPLCPTAEGLYQHGLIAHGLTEKDARRGLRQASDDLVRRHALEHKKRERDADETK